MPRVTSGVTRLGGIRGKSGKTPAMKESGWATSRAAAM